MKEIFKLPLVMYPSEYASGINQNVLALYHSYGVEPLVAQEVGHLVGMIGLVAAGIGFALVPASVRGMMPDRVVYRSMKSPSAYSDISVVYPRHGLVAVREIISRLLPLTQLAPVPTEGYST